MGHTPLPWWLETEDKECVCATSPQGWLRTPEHPQYIVTQTGLYTSTPREEREANAAYIVTACNAHEKLLEAMEAIKSRIGQNPLNVTMLDVLRLAQAAIAKATP